MSKVSQSFVVLAMGFLCLLTGTQSRSVSVIGDIKIDIFDDKFLCDRIECPTNTNYCVVTKEKDPQNATVLVRSDTCYSSSDEVLKDLVINETIDANTNVQIRIVASRNGITSMSNSYTSNNADFDMEKFNKEFSEKMSNFHQQLSHQMENLRNRLAEMGRQLGNLYH